MFCVPPHLENWKIGKEAQKVNEHSLEEKKLPTPASEIQSEMPPFLRNLVRSNQQVEREKIKMVFDGLPCFLFHYRFMSFLPPTRHELENLLQLTCIVNLAQLKSLNIHFATN